MAVAAPDWVVSSEETAAAMADWARARGLRYERLGLLPPASRNLRARPGLGADGWARSRPVKGGATDALYRSWGPLAERPVRFSENLCWGELAPGLHGTLAHHSSAHDKELSGTATDASFVALVSTTAVVVPLPEAGRLTRAMAARPKPGRKVIELGGKAAYGELLRPLDLTPQFGKRYQWTLWLQDDPALIAPAFANGVMRALEAAPERTGVAVDGGMLVVDALGYRDDAESLEALVQLAAELVPALRAAAARLPRLEPGTALPAPADTAYRSWARDGAARVDWPSPPANLATARQAYEAQAAQDEAAKGRGCSVETAAAALAVLALLGALRR